MSETTQDATELELLTPSRLRTARECSRKHQYMYVDGWRPNREEEALRIGTLVHRGLEAWWTAVSEPAAGPLNSALAAVAGLAADAFEQVRVEEMLRGYDAHWRGDIGRYAVLAVEARYDAPLLNPETFRPSRTWRLAGKVDVIVRDVETDRVLVVEHKTTSEDFRSDDSTYWLRLGLDPQISEYVLGAEALGHRVDEILYDVLGKPGQRPLKATPPESRKYTKDGRLYAAQREVDEMPEEYRTRIAVAIVEAPDRYYARRLIPRAESQVKDFLADAWQQAGAMRDAARLGRAARNPDACLRYGMCPFFSVCVANGSPADYPADFHLSVTKHPELQETI